MINVAIRPERIAGFLIGQLAVFTAHAALPIRMLDNLPYVPVQIEYQTFLMMLDLGADDRLKLPHKVATVIRISPLADASHQWDAMGHAIEERRFRIPSLRIGNVTFRKVESCEERFAPDYGPPDKTRGHIGLGLLRDYKIVLDYRINQMWLLAKNAPAA